VVNGHKSAAHTDPPDGGAGKMCLGGGVHCPSASSCYFYGLDVKTMGIGITQSV